MRANKYRGKQVDNNEWVYGYYVATKDSHYICYDNQYNDDLFLSPKNILIEVIPETVGQFTERYDNFDIGKEIYEDDVCSFAYNSFNRLEQVVYLGGSFCLGWCMPLRHVFLDYNKEVGKSIKIIGNIHDNPELLKL